ncbi:UDP-glucose 4-epimerase [Aquisphaera giovannonii]|uniref:UDP-glucose 4-epimerase n=1 Tax=Aquisphaera giovannonii TaxID=406548 RepID=A0A5B9W8B7_9BACT|nr:NAD-dependent epimerase/dehydratase family protein [Aquisphaera giovannonii]QEH36936.1 UDP-glucose 4-epimerase [Aquisphaera giovannonii]
MPGSSSLPRALVTGAAGFIGSHVVRALQAQGRVEVVALDDLSGGFRRNLPADIDFVEASITDHGELARLFDRYRFRYVFHLAAYAAEGLSHFIRRFNYTNNVLGSINLINESVRHEIECFVFTSSIATYGAVEPPMREDQRPCPEDPYGVAKLAIELDLAAARHMFGLPYVIFRPHNVYGEFQNLGDPYRNVIGIFMNQIMQGRPMSIFGDGTQRRAFSYVGDIAPVLAECPWVPGARNEVFNIGADADCSVNELAHDVAVAMGRPDHPIEHLRARNEVSQAYSDHTKARRIFGDRPQTPLPEGLARMAEWAREAGVQRSKPFEGVEVTRNFPPSWRALLDSSPRSSKHSAGEAAA